MFNIHLDKNILDKVLEAIEHAVEVEESTQNPQYKVKEIYLSHILQRVTDEIKCSNASAYYAIRYAAQKKLIDAQWNSDKREVTGIIDLTPDGHDYLSKLRKEDAI